MDFELSPEQKLILETVRRFVREEIVPLETDLDPDASELPPRHRERLVTMTKELGFYGLDIPEEYGGPGIDLTTRTLMAFEMAQHRAGLYAPCYGVFGGAGLAQLYEADDGQKERYLYPVLRGEKRGFFALTEPSGGSDPARAIRTTAVRDGDDWILDGEKTFISGADKADFGIVFARTDPELGRKGITCFLVDTDMPGFRVRRIVHTLRSTHYAAELEFNRVRVPGRNVLGEVNQGFAIANDRLSRNRIPYAAGCVFRTEAAICKLVASEGASRVVDRAMQIHGGYGMTKDLPLERWYRELRIRRVGEGPNEIQRLIVARDVIGGSFH